MKLLKIWLLAALCCLPIASYAAQNLSGTDVISNKPVSLAQYHGQTVLLVFFSAGCDVCVHNFKLIREFYKANKKSHFGVIGIGLDKKGELFRNYAQLVNSATPKDEQFPMIWRNAAGHQDSFGAIKHDPSVFVIGKNGDITLKREGIIKDNDWDDIWTSLQEK